MHPLPSCAKIVYTACIMMTAKTKKTDPYNKYVDPTGEISNRELEVAAWYVTHKESLKKFGTGLLAAFCVATAGYGIYGWLEYLIVGYREDRAAFVSLGGNAPGIRHLERNPAEGLSLGAVYTFQTAAGRYDMAAEAKNDRPDMTALVTFRYVFSGGESARTQRQIMPAGSAILAAYGVESDGTPQNASLVVDSVAWQRVNPHTVPDPAAYVSERLRFAVENVAFVPAASESDLSSSHISFDAVNPSAYSYWQARFDAAFFDGEELTGVAPITIDRFRSGERRRVDYATQNPAVRAREVRLYPDLNIFDRAVYMPPGQL